MVPTHQTRQSGGHFPTDARCAKTPAIPSCLFDWQRSPILHKAHLTRRFMRSLLCPQAQKSRYF